jgi:cellulose biosynthesis protein BcsQ
MKIFALYNIKGGVGKTAGAVNLSYLSARDGFHTLIIDLDPQAACSFYLRTDPGISTGRKSWLKGKKKIIGSIKGTDYRNLEILPSDFSHRNLDLILSEMKKPKKRLARGLRPMTGIYDVIFIDCPPNITLVSENVFNAADHIIIPVIPTVLSARTFAQLDDFLGTGYAEAGKLIPFFSMVEKRKNLHLEMIRQLSSAPANFLKTQIPYASLVEKMGSHREPVECFAPASPAAKAYRQLWKEIKKVTKLEQADKLTG